MIRMPEATTRPGEASTTDDPGVSPTAIRWTAIGLGCLIAWTAWDLHAALVEAVDRVAEPADGLRIDPARATAAELELVPGIGPATAGRIVQHRLRHGSESLIELDDEGGGHWRLEVVSGIGPITARRAAPYLVHPASAAASRLDDAAVRR